MIMKKLKQLGLVAILAVVCALAGGSAMAQQQQERAASGQSNTLGSSSRIDATKVTVNRFITTQEANISGLELIVNQTHTTLVGRLGEIRNTLVNFNTTPGGCDPRLGPQGCKCACGAPDQKLLWDASASKWQCYQVQNPQCASGMQFNPNTCKCESTVCQPRTCPTGQTWDYANCRCKPCDGQCPGECPAGMKSVSVQVQTACGLAEPCMCADYVQVPNPNAPPRSLAMIHPRLEPYANIVNGDSGCRRVASCKFGMELKRDGNGPNCCCPYGSRFKDGRCGDICPSGYSAIYIGHSDGPVGVCYKTGNGRYYETGNSTCEGPKDVKVTNDNTTCGGGSLTCCERRVEATDFATGFICAPQTGETN